VDFYVLLTADRITQNFYIMNIPENLKYTSDHEWVRAEGDLVVIGITDFAQSELGDVVFVEVETTGETLAKGESFGTIEAVKTVSDMYMPAAGEVVEMNEALEGNPELINKDPYGEGWVIKVRFENPEELNELLSAEAYAQLIGA
jgi:glycine cleavage system H protein